MRDPDTRQAFKIEVQNRFESLFVEEEEEEVRNVNGDGGEQAQDMTTRKLSGIRCNQNRPIRSEKGRPASAMEETF